jgi:hypothetical protein
MTYTIEVILTNGVKCYVDNELKLSEEKYAYKFNIYALARMTKKIISQKYTGEIKIIEN